MNRLHSSFIDVFSCDPEIAIVCRREFHTGIGSIGYTFYELLARSYPVCLFPIQRDFTPISLPNGRMVSLCKNPSQIKVWIYTDVLWNAPECANHFSMPDNEGLKICVIAFDSDEIPQPWVEIIERRFDAVIVTNPELIEACKNSGVSKPVITMPLGMDVSRLIGRRFIPAQRNEIKFISVSSFHPRKGHELLIQAFEKAFGNSGSEKLAIHSNLLQDHEYFDYLKILIEKLNLKDKVTLSHCLLSETDKINFINCSDILVNVSKGEGFSMAPREALALGKTVVLSKVGGQIELDRNIPGMFFVAPSHKIPAFYPEINHSIIGKQEESNISDIVLALKKARQFVLTQEASDTEIQRRQLAYEYSFEFLTERYARLLSPERANTKILSNSMYFDSFQNELSTFNQLIKTKLKTRTSHLKTPRNTVVQAHDGGYFSLFNVFMSHLVWNSKDPHCEMTLPDWDVSRLIHRKGDDSLKSFCYASLEDQNVWTKLYEPLYGLTEQEMNNEEILYQNARTPTHVFNDNREPNLTYKYAHRLYKTKQFYLWRKEYNKYLIRYIFIKPHLQNAVDKMAEHFDDRYMIAAHIRHPAHKIEQKTSFMAGSEEYIKRIKDTIKLKGLNFNDQRWGVFLATDQESIINRFKDIFGDHLFYFPEVRRASIAEENTYHNLTEDEKQKEGNEVQHIVASSKAWSYRMAEEVILDAYCMAKCDMLLHVVSNISTAVSFLNPDLQMEYCEV